MFPFQTSGNMYAPYHSVPMSGPCFAFAAAWNAGIVSSVPCRTSLMVVPSFSLRYSAKSARSTLRSPG
jgi:hypothetical protein